MTPDGVCTFLDTLVISSETKTHRKMSFYHYLLKLAFLASVLPRDLLAQPHAAEDLVAGEKPSGLC